MEISPRGKVVTAAKIENLADLLKVREGSLSAEQVRRVEVNDALVDTGATMLSLPRRLIQQLGLQRHRTRTARTPAGTVSFGIYEPVRLTVQERDCVIEVAEIPDECPPLIGQVPLGLLDLVVDPARRALIGNPEHGGEQMIELVLSYEAVAFFLVLRGAWKGGMAAEASAFTFCGSTNDREGDCRFRPAEQAFAASRPHGPMEASWAGDHRATARARLRMVLTKDALRISVAAPSDKLLVDPGASSGSSDRLRLGEAGPFLRIAR